MLKNSLPQPNHEPQTTEHINLTEITSQFIIKSKTKFSKYLKEIFVDLSSRTNEPNKGISRLVFASYYTLPGIILDRLFAVMNSSGSPLLSFNDFFLGMMIVFTGSFESLSKFIFSFYDFDNDQKITKEDVRTILSYISLSHSTTGSIQGYKARVSSQEELREMLDKVFTDKESIDYKGFINVIENVSCDVYLLIVLFLYVKMPFTKETIDAYGDDDNNNEEELMKSKEDKTVASPSKIKTLSPYKILRKLSTKKKRKATMPDEMSHLNRRFMNDDNIEGKKNSIISLVSAREINDDNSNERLKWRRRRRFNDEDEEEIKKGKEDTAEPEKIVPQRRQRDYLKKDKEEKKKTEKEEEPDDNVIGVYQNMGFCFNKSLSTKNTIEIAQSQSPGSSKFNSTTGVGHFSCQSRIVEANEEDDDEMKKESESDFDSNDSDIDSHSSESEPIIINNNNIYSNSSDSDNLGFKKNYITNKESDDDVSGLKASSLNSPKKKKSSFSPDRIKTIKYENYLFKYTNDKLKKIYFKLINKDLYYYRTHDQKKHSGMHNLSGVFLKEEAPLTFNNKSYFAFSLHFSSKKRFYYSDDQNIFNEWLAKLKKVSLYNDLSSLYTMSSVIGEGKFGLIKLGMDKLTGRNVAIKIINKETMSSNDLELVRTEIEIMKICQHPNIIRLYNIYEDTSVINIVMEYCPGGDLYSYLEKRNFILSEPRACELIHKLCTAIFYIHSYGVVHRDLKPENILMTDSSDEADIRILDFGLSKIMGPEEKCTEPFGTMCYVSPEVLLEKPYTKSVDVWAIGVITYLMLCGQLPFDSVDGDESIAKKTVLTEPNMNFGIWKTISDEAKDLIKLMLEKNPDNRISVKSVLEHRWFSKHCGQELINTRKNSINRPNEFRVYSSTLNDK